MIAETMTPDKLGTDITTFDFMVDTAVADIKRRDEAAVSEIDESPQIEPVYHSRADRFLAAMERWLKSAINEQVAEALEQDVVQRLEASQRGLKGLATAAAAADLPLDVCNVDKATLSENLEANEDDVTKSEFFDATARIGYLTEGADPNGLVILDYTFGPDAPETKVLGLAAKCGVAGQFVVGAQMSARALNAESDAYAEVTVLPHSYREQLEDPKNGSLRMLQQKGEAQHLVLAGPRVLMRPAFHPERFKAKGLDFFEQIVPDSRKLLWGPSLWSFAQRYAASVGKFGWPSMVCGFDGASQEFANATDHHGRYIDPVEIRIDDYVEKNLSEYCRLLTFYPVKNLPVAAALTIPSAYTPNPDAKPEEKGNERIAACAVYTMLQTFVSHELKSRLRHACGRQMTTKQLETELSEWIHGELCLGNSLETASENDKASRPFSMAQIVVTQPVTGVFHCKLNLTPIAIVEEAQGQITIEEDSL